MTDTIQDTGKVWLRGTPKPVFAVRVADRIVIPGVEEGQTFDCWEEDAALCVDIQDSTKRVRIARYFNLTEAGSVPGTLFNGFTKTKHSDVQALTPESPNVRQQRFDGEAYDMVKDLDRAGFWHLTGWGAD